MGTCRSSLLLTASAVPWRRRKRRLVKKLCVAGGAATAQQFLNAGYIDEIQIHLVSVLLGTGLRLFDHVKPMQLERTRVLESPGVTHLQFRVVK